MKYLTGFFASIITAVILMIVLKFFFKIEFELFVGYFLAGWFSSMAYDIVKDNYDFEK